MSNGGPPKFVTNIRKDFLPLTSSIPALDMPKWFSLFLYSGLTRIRPWISIVTSTQVCVSGCITVCSVPFVVSYILRVCILVPLERWSIQEPLIRIPNYLHRCTVFHLNSTIYAGGKLLRVYHKSHNRGLLTFLVGWIRRRSTSPTWIRVS